MTVKQGELVRFLKRHGRLEYNGRCLVAPTGEMHCMAWNWLMRAAASGLIKHTTEPAWPGAPANCFRSYFEATHAT